ncbi:metal-dependent transcriptional regulator [Aureivirga marina]|uniref:metal-dependent transcriptional regulator n=1 Tax=Aureivirga marina TaxID=1182451 RepID=UPI0018C92783|nr:metal-dependent transcriptional regulator [Aureivirga marina]
MSVATENFIKAIYNLGRKHEGDTKPGSIASFLNISNAAATDMAKNLSKKNLVNYEKYKELKLTKEGELLALRIVRKHRLWEALLFKLFNMSLHEIHIEAELLEHQTSDFLAQKMDEYLGFPKYDPHGDPIPDVNGIIHTEDHSIVLLNAEEGKKYQISRLVSVDKDFFDFCAENGLNNGAEIEVVKQYEKNKMTQIKVAENILLLNNDFTKIIYVNEKN